MRLSIHKTKESKHEVGAKEKISLFCSPRLLVGCSHADNYLVYQGHYIS
jgi:hypothetical protein